MRSLGWDLCLHISVSMWGTPVTWREHSESENHWSIQIFSATFLQFVYGLVGISPILYQTCYYYSNSLHRYSLGALMKWVCVSGRSLIQCASTLADGIQQVTSEGAPRRCYSWSSVCHESSGPSQLELGDDVANGVSEDVIKETIGLHDRNWRIEWFCNHTRG